MFFYIMQKLGVNMTHIESRPSKSSPGEEYDFYVECRCSEEHKLKLVEELKDYSTNVSILSRDPTENEGEEGGGREGKRERGEREGVGREVSFGLCFYM